MIRSIIQSRLFLSTTLATVALLGTAAAALPYTPTSAQGRAEQACRHEGVQPNSPAWELCLSHVTRAYEWGERGLAAQLARVAGNAREACLSYGLKVETSGYRTCLSREIDAHSELLILGDDQSGTNVAQLPAVDHP